ncbi:MAG: NAD-dependent epimerase/dehydratase family protein [Brevibacillus sp.]|nr:NAD-dependent epimerase/dehydratase family protein [Brevibacillus sp.]
MNKAVVLGATGGMGSALVHELHKRGIEVVAFARSREKLKGYFSGLPQVKQAAGDAYVTEHIVTAAQGADVIFHCVSVPYPEWAEKHPRLMKTVLEAARQVQARVVVIDNIYPYGYSRTERVSEDHPKQPHTRKGQIRCQVEEIALASHRAGTPVMIVRLPDFYGPYAQNTALHFTLKAIATGKAGIFVGSLDVPREYIYMPDAAQAVVTAAEYTDGYGENWNIPGAGVITGREILQICQQAAGKAARIISVGRSFFAIAGLFDRGMREVKEMLYLMEQPVVLSGEKYERRIGPIPKTPYREGLTQTIRELARRYTPRS